MDKNISIRGAREHNLTNVNIELPRNELICFTGVSGSGKSSLAFDTLYAEGQRRYVESLSSFARQYLGQMPKPDVDLISGLSPSISIAQKTAGSNPRSTVGTITEIYDYLRVLYARIGVGHCPVCGKPVTAQTRQQIVGRILSLQQTLLERMSKSGEIENSNRFDKSERQGSLEKLEGLGKSEKSGLSETSAWVTSDGKPFSFYFLAPKARHQKGEFKDLFEELRRLGYARVRVDGEIRELSEDIRLDRNQRHNIEAVIDRLSINRQTRPQIADAVEAAMKAGDGEMILAPQTPIPGIDDISFSSQYACATCGLSFSLPTPQMFSFNSPQGMCPECSGLGEIYTFDPKKMATQPELSIMDGAIELLPPWKDLGKWRRSIYQGVAEYLQKTMDLPNDYVLTTPWQALSPAVKQKILWGTGDAHLTFSWKAGSTIQKWGGPYEGLIPSLLSQYKSAVNAMQKRHLEKFMDVIPCGFCEGERLNVQARHVKLHALGGQFDGQWLSLPAVCRLSIDQAQDFFAHLALEPTEQIIAGEALKEIQGRLSFLTDVGLSYLSLGRTAPTLSGGEMQRIRLAGQIGCGLVGVLYILDEPSIGLHPRDNVRLLNSLCRLRDLGNTVVVVEHDEDTMRSADMIVDFGPGAGGRGGNIVAAGSLDEIVNNPESVTGAYLSGKRRIAIPESRREGVAVPQPMGRGKKAGTVRPVKKLKGAKTAQAIGATAESSEIKTENNSENQLANVPYRALVVRGARHHNLKNIDVEFPLGKFICVTGVSGSGKSSLVNGILVEALHRDLNRGLGVPGDHDCIEGLEYLDKMIAINQSPIGRTPRSNPATYIKLFDEIRDLFASLPDAKAKGFKSGRFSFNVQGGRCEACQGNGANKLEMDFLADIWTTCPVCNGKRFNAETLSVEFKGKSIADVLEMDVNEAMDLFVNIPKIYSMLKTLADVGLGYMKIGQPSPTLSGGEAQRIKLAKELIKVATGRTLYMLDEPTTGLHFADIDLLLKVLHNFVELGNTVIVIEHNLDVIKTADWVIELGPDGGSGGGHLVFTGTPEDLIKEEDSPTGKALKPILEEKNYALGSIATPIQRTIEEENVIRVEGASEHNLKSVDLTVPRNQLTVCCGPSGSGKSSLAIDTIYAEGQRRYVESLSSYARQFVGQMSKPKVDSITGLSPAIAIEQKRTSQSPRSTVGTVSEIYDYFRILFARLGQPYCPDCQIPVGTQSSDEIVDRVLNYPEGTRLYLLAPLSLEGNQKFDDIWNTLKVDGFSRVRLDGVTYELGNLPSVDKRRRWNAEILIDRIEVNKKNRSRIATSVELALSRGLGCMNVAIVDNDKPETRWKTDSFSQHFSCSHCGRSFEPLTPNHFSFNSALGWCPECEGLGVQMGADLSVFVEDDKLTLAEGAVELWPNVDQPLFKRMLDAFSRETEVPIDVPFNQLAARHRRIVLQGFGDRWIDVYKQPAKAAGKVKTADKVADKTADKNVDKAAVKADVIAAVIADELSAVEFSFQYRGLYPTLDLASRIAPGLRSRLSGLRAEIECPACGGSRLRADASSVRLKGYSVDEIGRMPLDKLYEQVVGWNLTATEQKIAGEIQQEILHRVKFLLDVGLDYLTLSRPASSLSGGEMQRIRLASQIGSGLCGVLYVLDEPTIGLHPHDNARLLKALRNLRDIGNTVLVVEHDKEIIEGADQILDFGPVAGAGGGELVAEGTPDEVRQSPRSVTGPFLSGKKSIPIPANRREIIGANVKRVGLTAEEEKADRKASKSIGTVVRKSKKADGYSVAGYVGSRVKSASASDEFGRWLTLTGVRQNNLKNIDVSFPLGAMTVVTGLSGSGKSSLVEDVLYNGVARILNRSTVQPGLHDGIIGLENLNKIINVDQRPIGQTPLSNLATYTGLFDEIRYLFGNLPEAKLKGFSPRRFSFNVPGGRCEKCEGYGQLKVEMHFLPDVWVTCDACDGQRYEPETLSIKYHGFSISDVLNLSCKEALKLFASLPRIRRILQTLCDVGLDYIALGQSAPTLSGGEAQRIKLATELSRPDTGKTLYVLDEPTTGLHFEDLTKLLEVFHRLVDLGNTVIVIEHNLDIVKSADWIIDIGPGAGANGGEIVAAGTPEQVVAYSLEQQKTGVGPVCYTGLELAPVLQAGPYLNRAPYKPTPIEQLKEEDIDFAVIGQDARMPWETDGPKWHTQDRVSRNGNPCRWDGQILARIVDYIDQKDCMSATNWKDRALVEIRGPKKSQGWFFHASTAEEWLLKLRFSVPKGTFTQEDLDKRLDLKPLNDMPELPLYGTASRVKVEKGHLAEFDEIELKVHYLSEINRPEFWTFLDQAIDSFLHITKEDEELKLITGGLTPWKVLGRSWHLMPSKGFHKQRRPRWKKGVLEKIVNWLETALPDAAYGWTNKSVVSILPKGHKTTWAHLKTKLTDAVHLEIHVPKNHFPMGELTNLGPIVERDGEKEKYDSIKFSFQKEEDFSDAVESFILKTL